MSLESSGTWRRTRFPLANAPVTDSFSVYFACCSSTSRLMSSLPMELRLLASVSRPL